MHIKTILAITGILYSIYSWGLTDQTSPLVAKALQAEQNGKYEDAISIYKEVFRLTPHDFEAANSIAGLYGTIHNFELEINWANTAITLSPSDFRGYINLGNGLAGIGKLNAAKIAFAKAAKLSPNSPLPPYSLALVAEQQNQPQVASHLYEKSIKIDPSFEAAYLNLAALVANQNKFDEALDYLNRLLALSPNQTDALNLKRKIQHYRK